MRRHLRLPSPAMAVALVALFTALAGSAYAATVITGSNVKNGSLTGADLKNGTLGEKQIGKGKIEGSDIKDGALAARDIKAGSLTGDRFAAGQLPKGDKGDKGDPGITRWALINAAGQIEAQSGGFSLAPGYPTTPAAATGNFYLNTGADLAGKGIIATIALQNQTDQDGDGIMNGSVEADDSNPEFSGEISATRCQITGVVACAPPAAQNGQTLVVSPRLSNGQRTDTTNRKRFYVAVTG